MSDPTAPPPPAVAGGRPDRFPPQIKYIVGNEACERFSYYGLMGILETYLLDNLGLGKDGATETLHLFGMAVYFLPLLGGWLADRWLGRYWTILTISLFYCLGHGTLFMFGTTREGVFAGLALIAIGAGGIKPNVSAFVGDQFRPDQDHLMTKVYGWFYWAVNLGAAAAFFIMPILSQKAGYRWAFGVPGIAMGLATLVFWLGTRYYTRKPPLGRQEKPLRVFAVIWHALTHQHLRQPGSKFLDVALGPFSEEEVTGARSILGILMMFAAIPVFWALYNQVNSTWVVQGENMKPSVHIGTQVVKGLAQPVYLINGETMQAAGALLVMILVPFFTLYLYPLAERRGWRPTMLRRMSVGMVLAAVSFVLSGLIQARMDRGGTPSILWQLAPYIVLEAAEVLLSATALEFAFSQAPPQLKSVVMSLWYLTNAAGHFLIAAFTDLNQRFVHAKGASEFYFYSVLMAVAAGIFIILAPHFRYRQTGGATP